MQSRRAGALSWSLSASHRILQVSTPECEAQPHWSDWRELQADAMWSSLAATGAPQGAHLPAGTKVQGKGTGLCSPWHVGGLCAAATDYVVRAKSCLTLQTQIACRTTLDMRQQPMQVLLSCLCDCHLGKRLPAGPDLWGVMAASGRPGEQGLAHRPITLGLPTLKHGVKALPHHRYGHSADVAPAGRQDIVFVRTACCICLA